MANTVSPAEPTAAETDQLLKLLEEDAVLEAAEPTEESEAAAELPEEAAPPEVTAEEPESDAPTPPTTQRKLKVGDQELDEEEVTRGYLRQSDYTRKTQALAADRSKFEAEDRPRALRAIEEYVQKLKSVEELVASANAEPDWAALKRTLTPAQFQERFNDWSLTERRLQKVQQERQSAEAAAAEERQRVQQHQQAQFGERLLDLLPEWKDEARVRSDRDRILAYVTPLGFKPEELQQVTRPELFRVLLDAAAYRELQARVTAKGRPAPTGKRTTTTTIKPGAATPSGTREGAQFKGKMDRFTKSGRMEDAAAALVDLL